MSWTIKPFNLFRWHQPLCQHYTSGLLAACLLLVLNGCVSPARKDTPSTLPATNPITTDTNSAYVTLALDDSRTEWEFVQWLRTSGAHVEKDVNGEDRIFDSPACRAILVRYRRLCRLRLNVIAQNLANVNTTRDAQGARNPYRRKFVVADSSGTFAIAEDPSPFITRHMPGNPDADSNGYVRCPNVDPTTEKVDAMEASLFYSVVTRILTHFDPTFVGIENGQYPYAAGIPTMNDAGANVAKQRMLASIISKFPRVSDAKVDVKATQNQQTGKKNPTTATIVITTADTVEQSKSLVAPATNLVAGAVAGLTPQNVSVIINGIPYHASDSNR